MQEKPQKQSPVIQRLSVEEFAEALKDPTTILLDIRTPEELKETGVLRDDVVNINFYEKDFAKNLNKLDKNASYLIYCRSGNRSGKALKMMKDL